MSAELTEEAVYSWYCQECDEGGSDFDSEHQAEVDRDEHNDEHHGGAE